LPPSAKFTVPVGEDPLTVAVRLTLAPAAAGLEELVKPVVVDVGAPALITWDSVALAEPALAPSPP